MDVTKSDKKAYVTVERFGKFEYLDETSRDNVYVFKGSENKFEMHRLYDEPWICEYDMRYYEGDFFMIAINSKH